MSFLSVYANLQEKKKPNKDGINNQRLRGSQFLIANLFRGGSFEGKK